MVERVFGETTIEELPRDYFCVSTDMLTSELVVHRRGLMSEAAAASMTLPGVFPPRPYGDTPAARRRPAQQPAGRRDGRRRRGADHRRPTCRRGSSRRCAGAAPHGRFALDELRARARAWVVGRGEPMPSFAETIVRSIVLGSPDTSVTAQQPADVVIEPAVAGCGLLEWKRIDELVAAGREAARTAMDKAPAFD